MIGINAHSGKRLEGKDHSRQSIADILTTPIGSRVMRRDYGSRLFELLDAPLNGETIIDLYAATAEALSRWEPRFKLESVRVSGQSSNGKITLLLSGIYLPHGENITQEVGL